MPRAHAALNNNGRVGRILLKNYRLIERRHAYSILPMGWRIGDDGTTAGGATGAFYEFSLEDSSNGRLLVIRVAPRS